ncbi:hypothetical protein HWA77_21345 [Photobacterium damselae subsp. damselae]|uniref:Uncharacterized protein n=1 Tax=Photobacterium damselae subsp. damselae TaxID=85581 RepID=A0A850R5N5_PHODD|nr:hypothetical protein [Photobacterium damselae subsp. damselae]
MKKLILASLVIMSQSAFCSDDFVSVDYPIISHDAEQVINGTGKVDGGHWDISYEHATKNGTHYDVQFKVTPTSKAIIDDYRNIINSSMVVGPFVFPQNGKDGFNIHVDHPEYLAHMFELQSSKEITLNGFKVTANIDNVLYDPTTHATTVNFSFDSENNIAYLPKSAGYAAIIGYGTSETRVSFVSNVSGHDMTNCTQTECFVSLSRLASNPEFAQQLYVIE